MLSLYVCGCKSIGPARTVSMDFMLPCMYTWALWGGKVESSPLTVQKPLPPQGGSTSPAAIGGRGFGSNSAKPRHRPFERSLFYVL